MLRLELTMSRHLEILEAEVMQLPAADKSHLLERLIATLDVDEEYQKAWEAVAEEREAELDSGSAVAVPLEEAMQRLRARLAG